jgi:hypothetical protein
MLARLMIGIEPENDTHSNMVTFLEHHGYAKTIMHQNQVAEQAVKLARRFDVNEDWTQIKILGIKQFRRPVR